MNLPLNQLRNRMLVIATMFLVTTAFPVGEEQKIMEANLRAAIKNRILILKTPTQSRSITFDNQGLLKKKSDQESCPSPICGFVQIDKVKVSPKQIEFSARRIVLLLIPGNPNLQTVGTEEKVHLVLSSDQPLTTDAQIATLMKGVFQSGDSNQQLQASYWKSLVSDEKKQTEEAKNSGKPVGLLQGDRPVYIVNIGTINPPKPTYTPDPEYNQAARSKGIGGTSMWTVVINENGIPEIIGLSKPAGSGLDWAPVTALSHWRFQPATKDGKPVAVKINVEINFRSY